MIHDHFQQNMTGETENNEIFNTNECGHAGGVQSFFISFFQP